MMLCINMWRTRTPNPETPMSDNCLDDLALQDRYEQIALTKRSHDRWFFMEAAGVLAMTTGIALDCLDTLPLTPRDGVALLITAAGLSLARHADEQVSDVHSYMGAMEISHGDMADLP
jgi:hypothetical protein